MERGAAAAGGASAFVVVDGLFLRGLDHYYGRNGAPQSVEEAVRLLRLAADRGHPVAQSFLAKLYMDGNGVERSYEEAARLALGMLYNNGEDVEESYEEAARLYKSAARNGNKKAMRNLANHYIFGLGVEKDMARAKFLLRQAEEAEDDYLRKSAQTDLASIKTSCASCGAKGNDMKVCVRCQGPRYCGRKCQRADWPQHRRVCRSKAETAAMLLDANDDDH